MALTLRQIEAFRAVVIVGTVVRGAEMLHVTQPAVSRLIADMEYEIGYPLFHRGRGGMVPTEEGRLLFAEIERAFIGLGQIEDTARAIRDLQAGRLSIAAMSGLGSWFLPRVIAAFLRVHASVSVSLEICSRELVMERVARQQYDIGFTTLPTNDPGIRAEILHKDELVCFLPIGHPLAARSVVHAKDMEGEAFISFPSETFMRFRVDEIFSKAKVRRRLQLDVRTAEAMRNLVAAGCGVTVMGVYGLSEPRLEDVVIRPFHPTISINLGMLFPVHRTPSLLVKRFAETAMEVCGRDMMRNRL